MIFLSSAPFHIPKVFLHIFAIYNKTTLLITDYCTMSTLMHSLLLAATSLQKRVGDHPERRGIAMSYSDAGLPTLTSNNRIIRNVTLINTFHNSIDDTLTNNPLSFLTGHWFSKRGVDAWTKEWFNSTVETAFQVTLTAPQTVPKPLSEHLLEDLRSSWTAPPPGDQHCHFTPLGEPPGLTIPNFIKGVLTAESHMYQSATFQIITGHTFDATYSSWFCTGTDDNITCPYYGDRYCYWPWECQAAIDRHASCKLWLTGAMGTVFVLEQQDRLALW